MKTININLIGELNKDPQYNKAVIQKDDFDVKTKLYVVVFLVFVFLTLTASVGIWFVTNSKNAEFKPQLQKLKDELVKLEQKESKLLMQKKKIENQLKVAKFKKIATDQINANYIPWSDVLTDIATKIPREIIVLDIDKTGASRSGGSSKLRISGMVPAEQKNGKKSNKKPLTTVSFLILNINEDPDSLFNNAEIKKIGYEGEKDIYQFEIETDIYTSKQKAQKK